MRYSTKQKDAYRTRRNIEYGSKEIRFPIILSVTSIYFTYEMSSAIREAYWMPQLLLVCQSFFHPR
jgi:hypothetical protein